MAGSQPATGPESGNTPQISIKGVNIPVKRWAIVCISLLVVLFVASMAWVYVWKVWKEAATKIEDQRKEDEAKINALNLQNKQLEQTKKEAEAAFLAKLQEYRIHFTEQGQHSTLANGKVKFTTYKSGCVFVRRESPGKYAAPEEWWLIADSKASRSSPPNITPSPTDRETPPLPSTAPSQRPATINHAKPTGGQPRLYEVSSTAKPHLQYVQGGRCLQYHSGPFNWWWGAPNGCWAPMFRAWPDGCQHYQWYNTCGGYWDPAIHWTNCVH